VEQLKSAIQAGGTKRAWDECTGAMFRMHRGAELFEQHLVDTGQLRLPASKGHTKLVCWVYGPSRYGKTEYFKQHYGDENCFVYDRDSVDNGKSHDFTGYCGEPVLILDDVRPLHWPLHSLRRHMSKNKPLQLTRKGIAAVLSRASVVVITNLKGPSEYTVCVEDIEQIYGRIDYTINITKPYNPRHQHFTGHGEA